MLLYFKIHNNINLVERVNENIKIHTCRNNRKPNDGDPLFLRCGKVSSRQVCISTQEVKINGGVVTIDGEIIDSERFAINGGFESKNDITSFYGPNYSGLVIHFTNFRY